MAWLNKPTQKSTENRKPILRTFTRESDKRQKAGLPVKEPTLVGGIIREAVAKPILKAFQPLGEFVRSPRKAFGTSLDERSKEKYGSYVGAYDVIGNKSERELRAKVPSGQTPKEFYGKDLKKEIKKSVAKSTKEFVGTGAEIASIVPIGGGATTAAKGVFSGIIRKIAANLLRAGGESALGGAISEGGRALSEDKNAKEVLKKTAVGGVGGFVGGVALGAGGKLLGGLLNKVAPELRTLAQKALKYESPSEFVSGTRKEIADKIAQGKPLTQVEQSIATTKSEKELVQLFDTVKEVQPEGGMKIAKTAQDIRKESIERGVTEDFPELATFKPEKVKDWADEATKVLDTQPDTAKKIALGTIDDPDTGKVGAIFNAVKYKALQENDVVTLQELATSKVGVRAGQALKAFDSGYEFDPVKAMQKVVRERESIVLKGKDPVKTYREVANQIRQEIQKTTPTRRTWEDFISSIEC